MDRGRATKTHKMEMEEERQRKGRKREEKDRQTGEKYKNGCLCRVVNCGWIVAAAGQQSSTVVLTVPTVVVGGGSHQFGYDPARTNCPHCHADVVTIIQHQVGGLAWLICGIIILVGLFFWYACISFCVYATGYYICMHVILGQSGRRCELLSASQWLSVINLTFLHCQWLLWCKLLHYLRYLAKTEAKIAPTQFQDNHVGSRPT